MALKKDSFFSSVLLTAASHFVIALLNILILKLLADMIIAEGFGAYLTIRRFIGFIFSFLTVNMNMSLIRFINHDAQKAETLFLYSTLITTTLASILLMLGVVIQDSAALWLFGSSSYHLLIPATLTFLFANCFHVLTLGLFWGKQQFVRMNLNDICYWLIATGIIISLGYIAGDFQEQLIFFLYLYAGLSLLNDLAFLVRPGQLHTWTDALRSLFSPKKNAIPKAFFRYGFDRLPSGILFEALFFTPIIAATHLFGLKMAAYLGIIVAIARLVQVAAYPVGVIFFPKFSALQAAGEEQKIREHAQHILEFITGLPLLLGVFCLLFAKEVVMLWFGPTYAPVIPYLQLMCPFLGSLVAYVILRSLLDGYSNYPYVNIITLSAFLGMALVAAMLSTVFSGPTTIVLGFSAGMLILGLLSVGFTIKMLGLSGTNRKMVLAINWFLLMLAVSYWSTVYFPEVGILLTLAGKAGIAALMIAVSLAFYRYLRFDWIREVWQRARAITG